MVLVITIIIDIGNVAPTVAVASSVVVAAATAYADNGNGGNDDDDTDIDIDTVAYDYSFGNDDNTAQRSCVRQNLLGMLAKCTFRLLATFWNNSVASEKWKRKKEQVY
ncbi:hypothetical protein PoB_002436300 [Plakobranchus ocellatus]|uniref:Uncharacterized protein n=1 Tax=Plakobranchus ocellatus TaxID=259542 RepID=A0AAV3ZTR0_9GAST|nr:hypothetical protein PoB_002436300 [Plakobranchus ocellatus]